MHLQSLPNELLKKITQFLEPIDYMRLYRTSRLLHSKRMPYNFQAPTQDLHTFLRDAPLEAIETMKITDWTDNAIVMAFVRGLPVCQKLIESAQVSDRWYTLQRMDMPERSSKSEKAQGDTQERLLTICAMFGHNELIERLLDHGFGINNGNNCYMAPLGCAIIEQHADTCRLLIERGPRMDFIGKTGSAMHVAAEYSTPEIMEMLMNAGQDINLLYRDEMPLRRAAERGTVENVQWLLEQGSDLWMRGLRDRSILDHSVSNRHLDVFDYLLQIYLESEPPEYWKEDALTNAAHACNLEACQKLLDLGANVNGNPHSSATPLFKSVRVMYGRKFRQDVFDLLMEHDPNL